MTTFLWVLAAIGAVGVGALAAFGLGRMGGHEAAAGSTLYEPESDRTRYELDNRQRFNTGALAAAVGLVGILTAIFLAAHFT